MLPAIGIVVILIMVFVPYALSGGNMEIILHGIMFEGPTIMGAAIGAFLIGNKPEVVKGALTDITLCFKGAHWSKDDYKDLLCIMFSITKTIKTKGMIAIESHIEKPSESSLFNQYPRISHDHHTVDLICNTLRMVTMSLEDPYQIEETMQKQLEKHHNEILAPSSALTTMSDGLPAIGIVAAVLGVIKTMASIDKPPTVLGAMIGGALVGTFLGVFLSYCLVAPMANKAKSFHEQDSIFHSIIRDIIIAHLKGNAPQISLEIGRGLVPTKFQPTFFELEEVLNGIKAVTD
jgi:chemotaxis protein MotA